MMQDPEQWSAFAAQDDVAEAQAEAQRYVQDDLRLTEEAGILGQQMALLEERRVEELAPRYAALEALIADLAATERRGEAVDWRQAQPLLVGTVEYQALFMQWLDATLQAVGAYVKAVEDLRTHTEEAILAAARVMALQMVAQQSAVPPSKDA